MTGQISDIPLASPFGRLAERIASFGWGRRIEISELPAPTRLAPDALALGAHVIVGEQELASGRLVLLHDPAGVDEWQGRHRIVVLAEASVDAEMAGDQLLAEVAWGWLVESLETHRAAYAAVAGTVTTISSRGFGAKDDEPVRSELEIRASWTPSLDQEPELDRHLGAWQDLLLNAAGLPPLPEGVTHLQERPARTTGRTAR